MAINNQLKMGTKISWGLTNQSDTYYFLKNKIFSDAIGFNFYCNIVYILHKKIKIRVENVNSDLGYHITSLKLKSN